MLQNVPLTCSWKPYRYHAKERKSCCLHCKQAQRRSSAALQELSMYQEDIQEAEAKLASTRQQGESAQASIEAKQSTLDRLSNLVGFFQNQKQQEDGSNV